MPLPKAKKRSLKHHRKIDVQGYQREDGLWDVEAHLTDTKSYTFANRHREYIPSGEPLHEMWLRLSFDHTLCVKEVEAYTEHGPFGICPDITENFKRLIGEQIKPGWTRRTRKLLGGIEGCTHLLELLGPIATTAFQTIKGQQEDSLPPVADEKPALLNSCHAFSESGSVIKEFHPTFYKEKK